MRRSLSGNYKDDCGGGRQQNRYRTASEQEFNYTSLREKLCTLKGCIKRKHYVHKSCERSRRRQALRCRLKAERKVLLFALKLHLETRKVALK